MPHPARPGCSTRSALKLAAYGEVAVSIADHSRTTHVTAELVDVGAGTAEADYTGKEVKGRVVLASGSLSTVVREAVWKRGALGIVSSHDEPARDAIDAPDQVAWGQLPYEAKDVEGVKDGTPGDLRGDDLAAARASGCRSSSRPPATPLQASRSTSRPTSRSSPSRPSSRPGSAAARSTTSRSC